MIPIFPESPLSILPLVVFLARSSSHQLHGPGQYLVTTVVLDKKMDVIGRDRIVQYSDTIALLRFKQPCQPPPPVSGKSKKKLLLVATMGNVPNISRHVMTICSRHKATRILILKVQFQHQKLPSKALLWAILRTIS
jgi:hypothetical protein